MLLITLIAFIGNSLICWPSCEIQDFFTLSATDLIAACTTLTVATTDLLNGEWVVRIKKSHSIFQQQTTAQMIGNLFLGVNVLLPLFIIYLWYFRVFIAIRKNSFRVQEARLASVRIKEVRIIFKKLSLLCWLGSFSVGSQLWCVTTWVLTWLILDFLDKENWFSLFFSTSARQLTHF